MTFCVIVLAIGFMVQGVYIHSLEKELETIKSWCQFCEIMKIRIPKNKGGDKK